MSFYQIKITQSSSEFILNFLDIIFSHSSSIKSPEIKASSGVVFYFYLHFYPFPTILFYHWVFKEIDMTFSLLYAN